MGITESKKHLTIDEIDSIVETNTSLINLFNQYKNAKGFLSVKDLESILSTYISVKIINKIYKLCATYKNRFNINDFKYLYCLFMTSNYEVKINFIADLIFMKKVNITTEKYKKRLDLYFNNHDLLDKLSNQEFISHMTNSNKIFKDNFLKNLDTYYKSYIDAFRFLDYKIEDKGIEKLILTANITVCECENKKLLRPMESFSISSIVKSLII